MEPENCPNDCKHETFHYCGQSGTHCDIHCICGCKECETEQKGSLLLLDGKDTGGRILSGNIVMSESEGFSIEIPDAIEMINKEFNFDKVQALYFHAFILS